jgi:hypothetical protein
MTKQQREARRERIRQLEQAEAKARCTYCRGPLMQHGCIVESFLDEGRFCSDHCLKAHEEQQR